MNLLEKKSIYRLLVLIFLFCDSIYSSEDEGFFSSIFSSEKPHQKTSQNPSQKFSRKASSSPVVLSSHNPHQNPQASALQLPHPQPFRPQGVMTEQVNPMSQQAGAFLQAFPKILKEMAELERHISTLIPEHPRNPKNLCNSPKSGDWRVLMAWSVKENLDTDVLERIKRISTDIEMLKKKKIVEKGKDRKRELQDSTLKDIEVKDEVLIAIHMWFMKTCNPSRQSLSYFSQDYSHFSQWWADLPLQLKTSQDVQLLYALLKEGSDPTMVLSLLNELLVQSILLKSRSLYEQPLPTFLDLKTAGRTLESLKEEALREDNKLKEILQNRELYKQIESLILKTIDSAVTPLLEDYLKQTTDDSLKLSVRGAFQQGLADALVHKVDYLPEKGPEESPDSVTVEESPNKILKEKLVKVIKAVVRETVTDGLNQATGRLERDEDALFVDIIPIIQTLSEFIKPPEKTTSSYWPFNWNSTKNSISTNRIQVPIPVDIQQQWGIPLYRSVARVTKDLLKKPKEFPKVNAPIVSFEESRKEYLKNAFPESNITPIRTGLLKEIRSLREYRYTVTHKQPPSLQEFLTQKNNVHLLFDFPSAYAHIPGIGGGELLPKILGFFQQYEGLITSYQRNLQETDKSDLSIYLEAIRSSINLCRSHKGPFFYAFPSLDPTELKTDWISLEIISLLEPSIPSDSVRDSFRSELAENVFLLTMVDGFPDESLNIGTLDITRLIGNAKKALLFKKKCEAMMGDKTFLLENDAQVLADKLFQEKCSEIEGVKEAIERMLVRQKSKKKKESDDLVGDHNILILAESESKIFNEDRAQLILFFTELFQVTLTKHLFELGLTSEKLETFKKISSPLQRTLEGDKGVLSSSIHPTQSTTNSKILPSLERDDQVTFHVPVDFLLNTENSLPRETEPSLQSRDAIQKKSDDSDLPPVQILKFNGEKLF